MCSQQGDKETLSYKASFAGNLLKVGMAIAIRLWISEYGKKSERKKERRKLQEHKASTRTDKDKVNPYVADEAEQGFILYNKMKPSWEAHHMEYSETVPMLRFKVG